MPFTAVNSRNSSLFGPHNTENEFSMVLLRWVTFIEGVGFYKSVTDWSSFWTGYSIRRNLIIFSSSNHTICKLIKTLVLLTIEKQAQLCNQWLTAYDNCPHLIIVMLIHILTWLRLFRNLTQFLSILSFCWYSVSVNTQFLSILSFCRYSVPVYTQFLSILSFYRYSVSVDAQFLSILSFCRYSVSAEPKFIIQTNTSMNA